MIDREKIIQGIEKAKAQGYLLTSGYGCLVEYENENGTSTCGCALTLAALGSGLMTDLQARTYHTNTYRIAGDLLGMTPVERTSFITGFDGDDDDDENHYFYNDVDRQIFLFGRELKKLIDI